MATRYYLYCDIHELWVFMLVDDDERVLYRSRTYKTKAAAASVAARKLMSAS